jgi:N utilization substance protein B
MKNDKAQKVTTREYMMKLLYQANVLKEDITTLDEKLDSFLEENFDIIKNRYEELRLSYSNNPQIDLENLSLDSMIDKDYMIKVCRGLRENSEKIDSLINKHAKNWTVDRMPIVDVSILRLSVCEILCLDDVPNKVSINEAVEIAKVYCDDKTPKFINGILGSVLGEIE